MQELYRGPEKSKVRIKGSNFSFRKQFGRREANLYSFNNYYYAGQDKKITHSVTSDDGDRFTTTPEDTLQDKIQEKTSLNLPDILATTLVTAAIVDKILAPKMRICKMKSKQLDEEPSLDSYLYDILSDTGFFVIKEQIDARPGDPQYRYELYKIESGAEDAQFITEDHEYIRQGDPTITLVGIDEGMLQYETRAGRKQYKI